MSSEYGEEGAVWCEDVRVDRTGDGILYWPVPQQSQQTKWDVRELVSEKKHLTPDFQHSNTFRMG
jgi:hypothetical protein